MCYSNNMPWTERAACSGMDTEIFYSNASHDRAIAEQACWECPVQEACRDAAVANGERYGIWGGYDAEQRYVLLGMPRPVRERFVDRYDEVAVEVAISGVRPVRLTHLERLQVVRRMTRQGYSIREIAQHINRDQWAVWRDLQIITKGTDAKAA